VPSKRRLRWAAVPVGIAAAVALAGCSPAQLHGFLPGFTADGVAATNRTDMVGSLWTTAWIVLLIIGLITWGLALWAAIVYRRRRGQTGLPVQMRYNMPIEIFYTIVPFILILGFFSFTARDEAIIETQNPHPDVNVVAYGKQWSWDFQYNGTQSDHSDAVWTMGVQAVPGKDGSVDQAALPTLYLPVDKTVRIDLRSRDVIHSFWIIDFLYKKDMYIGRDNSWSFTPTREGTYAGKCAELCGEFHSAMLFNVKVVSEDEYQSYLSTLKDKGQTGDINEAYSRLGNRPGTGAPTTGEGN